MSKQEKVDITEISKCFKRCFANGDGQKILNYLCSISLERAMPANISNDELRHLEGQKYMVKLILNHINN